FSSLSDIKFNSNQQSANGDEDGLPPIVNGKQVIKMDALSSGYKPNYFKVKVGVPVRWEIADEGTSGCTNAIISRGLFADEIPLTPGQVSVKEFTPEKPGKYKFSCWMGMLNGRFIVTNEEGGFSGPEKDKIARAAARPIFSGTCGCCGRRQ
ncbi:MAG: cupredoxin domain-containing protein, partial [Candidatus Omnitrophica bacterium]|nr:cupredoxin domain-containing protein [Candidatus Omnitrophota bacterium]